MCPEDRDGDPGVPSVRKQTDPLSGRITPHGTKTCAQANVEAEAVEEMLAEQPDDPNLIGWLAYRLYVAREYDRAAELYRSLLARGHEVAEQYFYLGNIHGKQGRHREAIACWRRVIELRPDGTQATKAQSRILQTRAALEVQSNPPPTPEGMVAPPVRSAPDGAPTAEEARGDGAPPTKEPASAGERDPDPTTGSGGG